MRKALSIGITLSLLTLASHQLTAHAREGLPILLTQAEPPAPPANAYTPAPALSSLEQSVFRQVNEYRSQRGLSKLKWDAALGAKARAHSQAMADKSIPFGHQGFQDRINSRAKETFSYLGAAENVAYNRGYDDPASNALKGWIASSGHRQNMEGQYNATGVGVGRNARGEYYFTQIFIRNK